MMDGDTDTEEHHDHDHDDLGDGDRDSHDARDSHSASATLAGFLFGNIDEKGELEEDFLDEVCMMWTGNISLY